MATIIPKTYKWAHSLVHRSGSPPGVVWHHAAGTGTPDAIHNGHVRIGDSGIAYHYYVRRDGRIYRGRPEWAMGAHCLGHNDWLGVCAEGNYDVTREMPAKQLAALQWLHDDIHRRRGGIPDKRHRDMSGNATACPGRYFPFAEVVAGVPAAPSKPEKIALTDKTITVPRQHKPNRAGWWNLGFVPWIAKVREQGDGDRIDTTRDDDRIAIPVPVDWPPWWRDLMAWRKAGREPDEPAPVVNYLSLKQAAVAVAEALGIDHTGVGVGSNQKGEPFEKLLRDIAGYK